MTSKDLEINQLKESFSKEKEEMQKEVGVKLMILTVIILFSHLWKEGSL